MTNPQNVSLNVTQALEFIDPSALDIPTVSLLDENGHLVKGTKPVYWSVGGRSALAEAEVEYENKRSKSIDVRFPVIDEEAFFKRCHHVEDHTGEGPLSVVIWTTTPWTLPANQAVSINPELEYSVVQVEGEHGPERLFLAEAMIKDSMDKWGFDKYNVIAYGRGEQFDLIRLQHPFYDRVVPLILGDHVTTEAGTGCVHTAPGHGVEDFQVGLKYDLEIDCPVDGNGNYVSGTPIFEGENVLKVDDHVLDVLKEYKALVHIEVIEHSYPHCWRTKTPLIFRATPQWFISMTEGGLRDKAMEAIPKVEWVPEWGQNRIEGMIDGRPDWCVSRQRFWGVPIAIFVHKVTSEMHPRTTELMEEVAKLVEEKSIDAWYDLDMTTLLGDEADDYEQVTDILDVWFDSGISHFTVLGQREELHAPADLYLEGSDQHRGWFQSSLLTALATDGQAPYKQVLTHGFTVDKDGKKMSKSKGNVIDPLDVIDGISLPDLLEKRTSNLMQDHKRDSIAKATKKQFPDGIPAYGTDALRFTFATQATSGRDVRFDLQRIEGNRNFCNKLWNAARYVQMQTDEKDIGLHNPERELSQADRWIVSRAMGTTSNHSQTRSR